MSPPAAASPPSTIALGREHVVDVTTILVAALVIGGLCGVASAVFLRGLQLATDFRVAHEKLLVPLLPVGAAALLWVVHRFGGRAKGGTAVVLFPAVDGVGESIPPALFPIALIGTWWTHLFGGSAGREGTAVQMGGTIADVVVAVVARVRTVTSPVRHALLLAGIAGGFGSVFGTPVAGAIFALEVAVAHKMGLRPALAALLASTVGSLVGNEVLHALGGAHGTYPILAALPLDLGLAIRFAFLGLAVGVVAKVFMGLMARIKKLVAPLAPWQRGVVGGLAIVGIWLVIPGTSPLLGLSVPVLEQAAGGGDVVVYAFALKVLLTAITLGIGLIGGEVTPLFVMGATLGIVCAGPLGLPPDQAACAALAAMFGACATTPIALIFMVVELCGAGGILAQSIVVVVATAVVRGQSIYPRR